MSIFQKSVLDSYLKSVDEREVKAAFEVFKKYYGDQTRLQNIEQSKEEQYQEGFLRDLFVDVFKYTINPNIDYNLTTEYKNLQDSKKADGAILKDGKAIAVIELKSNKTKNLESIEEQAFRYKYGQKGCNYVITSNYRLIRLYVDDATEYEEFNLFDLKEDEFKLMYLLLSKDSIFSDLPLKLKQDSKFHEDKISDKLYKDYSIFREETYQNLVKNNPTINKLELFKKTQKLLDRFLFIFFAEDRGLIPPNTIAENILKWEQLKDLDEYRPLYERFIKFFGYLNKGYEQAGYRIDAYNGGLFKEDEILDKVKIDDEPLVANSMRLSKYDFSSEIDVNILGHIFEHSLGEIEEKAAEIKGVQVDKTKSKRKKDGVFYTPKYITKYIVENTIGALCKEKKKEMGIDNIDVDISYRTKAGKVNKKGKELEAILQEYKKWLLTLKVLDPACGSGAFLNEALDFLIKEHELIDDMSAQILQNYTRLTDTDKEVLEHNLYGVDINEESVEIAKLSLWLRTAQKGRKLSDLSGNIKCGNSLIDDPDVAGDKAFNWDEEFKSIMDNGGFDIIIGNPPWGAYLSEEQLKFLKVKHNDIIKRMVDIYMFFINQSLDFTNENGLLGFIIPDVLLYQVDNIKLREKILAEYSLYNVVNLGDGVFKDVARPSSIVVIRNSQDSNSLVSFNDFVGNPELIQTVLIHNTVNQKEYTRLPNMIFATKNLAAYKLLSHKKTKKLIDIIDNDGIQRGVSPDLKAAFIVNSDIIKKFKLENAYIKKTVTGGKDVKRYYTQHSDLKLLYISKKDNPVKFPNIVNYISQFKDKITCKEVKAGKHPIYCLHRARNESIFTKPKKIIGVITSDKIICNIDVNNLYVTDGLYTFAIKDESLVYFALAVLNSKLYTYLYRLMSNEIGRTMSQVKPVILSQMPFVIPDNKTIQKVAKQSENLTNLYRNRYDQALILLEALSVKYNVSQKEFKIENLMQYDIEYLLDQIELIKVGTFANAKARYEARVYWEELFTVVKLFYEKATEDIIRLEELVNAEVYRIYNIDKHDSEEIDKSFISVYL